MSEKDKGSNRGMILGGSGGMTLGGGGGRHVSTSPVYDRGAAVSHLITDFGLRPDAAKSAVERAAHDGAVDFVLESGGKVKPWGRIGRESARKGAARHLQREARDGHSLEGYSGMDNA